MAIWGKTSNAESRPKSLPMDSNSGYSREFVSATDKGWVMQPGVASAATGNDNASADPEILVAIRNLASVGLKSANLLSVDWTDGAYADAATFDLVLTFDEPITVTSAAWSGNQTVTNKAYILLDRLGATDMVSDNTVACMYYAGTGTNVITFRGTLQSAAAGYLGFVSSSAWIHTNGTATLQDSSSDGIAGFRLEQTDDTIVCDANSTSSASGTTNGAVDDSTTITVDGVSGTIAVNQVVTVSGAGSAPAASITGEDSDTGISTDNTLTITAVASQTSFTVSERVTIADDINLLFSAGAGDNFVAEVIDMALEGADGATDVTGTQAFRTGFGVDTLVGRVSMLEDGTGKVINETDGTDGFAAEAYTVDAAGLVIETQSGSTSGSGSILNGVTTT
mgnify:FL=1|jgi:hypothetical protein|tara:strand:- start:33 stop:1217 length:1185 start_codon:yes stop_codon:yes gene_type:complete